jgi:hypothetical protein
VKTEDYDFRGVQDPSTRSHILLARNGSEIGRLTDYQIVRMRSGYEVDAWVRRVLNDWREREAS